MENLRIVTDTTGWSGNAGLAFSANKNTKSLLSFNANGHIQYSQAKDWVLLVTNFEIIDVDGALFNRSGFAHLRYNRKLSKKIKLELFNQNQFNSLSKIENRMLNGLGLRFKLSQSESAKFYYGLAYMHEIEKIVDVLTRTYDHRLSSYLSFTLKSKGNFKLTNTSYFQPLIKNFSDHRLSNETNFEFNISKHLSFITSFNYLFDSKPPTDVVKVVYSIRNGINFKF